MALISSTDIEERISLGLKSPGDPGALVVSPARFLLSDADEQADPACGMLVLSLGCHFRKRGRGHDWEALEEPPTQTVEESWDYSRRMFIRLGKTYMLLPNESIMAQSLEWLQTPADWVASIDILPQLDAGDGKGHDAQSVGIAVQRFNRYAGCVRLWITNGSCTQAPVTAGVPLLVVSFVRADKQSTAAPEESHVAKYHAFTKIDGWAKERFQTMRRITDEIMGTTPKVKSAGS